MTEAQKTCPKCGSPLVNITTGAVCPNGHEGLHPAVTPKEHAAAVRCVRLGQMPQATRVRGVACRPRWPGQVTSLLYTLSDRPGVWHRVKRISSSLGIHHDDTVLACETQTAEAVELVRSSAVEISLGMRELIHTIVAAQIELRNAPDLAGDDRDDVADLGKAANDAHELLASVLDPIGKLGIPVR